MKLGILALVLLIGFPLGLYLLVGKEAFNDANIVLGMMGVGAALLIMGCLFTVKNILSFFFDFLLITFGACLLLFAAFAKPLGLFDGEEGQEIEQRIMRQDVSEKSPSPVQPVEINDGQDIDKIMNNIAEGGQPEGAAADAAVTTETEQPAVVANHPNQATAENTTEEPALKQASMPKPVNERRKNEEEPEGLEAFAEEAGTRIIEDEIAADAAKESALDENVE